MTDLGEHVRLSDEDRTVFFSVVRQSPNFESWKTLEMQLGCGNTTLKSWRNGKRLLPKTVFTQLLDWMDPSTRKQFENAAVFFPRNWGGIKGGKTAIQKLKRDLGTQGYLNHFNALRKRRKTNPGERLAQWYWLLRETNPSEYARLMQKKASSERRGFSKIRNSSAKSWLKRFWNDMVTSIIQNWA